MQHLKLVQALDEYFPQWRSIIGESQRKGWKIGQLNPAANPSASVVLAEYDQEETNREDTALPWPDRSTLLAAVLARGPRGVNAGVASAACHLPRRSVWAQCSRTCLQPQPGMLLLVSVARERARGLVVPQIGLPVVNGEFPTFWGICAGHRLDPVWAHPARKTSVEHR